MDKIIPTESYIPSSLCMPLNFIRFVAQNEPNNFEPKKLKTTPQTNLNGSEISSFYENLVSEPSRKNEKLTEDSRPTVKEKSNRISVSKIDKVIKSNENLSKMIHHFAQYGNLEKIQECVSNRIDLNAKDSYGWTPLMCAVSAGHIDITKYLFECGVDDKISTPQGLRALDIAIKQDCPPEIIELLIKPSKRQYKNKKRVTTHQTNHKVINKQKIRFCNVCKKEFKDHRKSHDRSIAHLLNCSSRIDRTFYHIPECNKGYQIMLKNGWNSNKGLGPFSEGRKYPIKTILKKDRCCIGTNDKEIRRITHFGPHDISAVEATPWEKRKLNIRYENSIKKGELEKIEKRKKQKEIAFRKYFDADL